MSEGPVQPPANSMVDRYAVELKIAVGQIEAVSKQLKEHYVERKSSPQGSPLRRDESERDQAQRMVLECTAGVNSLLKAKQALGEYADLVGKLEQRVKKEILPHVV